MLELDQALMSQSRREQQQQLQPELFTVELYDASTIIQQPSQIAAYWADQKPGLEAE